MKRLIIEINYGGLGDHLFYSHIPRIAKLNGYDLVMISNRSKFRSHEIKELVWDSNPFVDGFTNDQPTQKKFVDINGNLLDRIMFSYGLDDGLLYHDPEIFLADFMPINNYTNSVIYDPNYVSYIGSIDVRILYKSLNHLNANMQLKFRGLGYPTNNLSIISTSTLLEYCHLIKSCSSFICFSSGSASLASALGKPSTVFYGNGQNKIFHHSEMHNYIDIGSYSIGGYCNSFRLKMKNKFRVFLGYN